MWIEKENWSCIRTKQKYDNIDADKHKQMSSSWQNDMLEQ